jgi:hypothetical protein
MTYRSYRLLPLLLIGFYLAIVLVARVNYRFDHRWAGEIFPFFNWSLFSYTSAERHVSTIRVDSVDGKQLSTPRFYYDMTDVFASAKHGTARSGKRPRP